MRGTHPCREGLDLLDGGWYADDPHEVWTWMRRGGPVTGRGPVDPTRLVGRTVDLADLDDAFASLLTSPTDPEVVVDPATPPPSRPQEDP
jgi:hypothetical protein